MNLFRISSSVIFLLLSLFLQAQTSLPLKKQEAALQPARASMAARHNRAVSSLQGSLKAELIKEYQKRYEHVLQLYSSEELITDTLASNYLQLLTQKIIQTRPELQAISPSIHFSRSWWPNAVSFGDGTIHFNINLFSRLENEAQAIFILCHELAHYYLNHSNNAIHEYVSLVNSAEFQLQLKTIQRSEYQRNRQLDQLVTTLNYSNRRHSRNHELEADSLALTWMAVTGYDVKAALRCLQLLDSIDKEKFEGQLALQEQFNFTNYPFKPKWIRTPSRTLSELKEALTQPTHEEALDSLKTHPDCQKRIAALDRRVREYHSSNQQNFLVNEQRFSQLIAHFDAEQIAYCIDKGAIGRALYYALQLFRQEPDNSWLAITIGDCLNKLFVAQQKHLLNTVIDLPGNTQNKEYETWLRLLQQVRLDELAALSYHFMETHSPRFEAYETYQKVKAESLKNYQTLNNQSSK